MSNVAGRRVLARVAIAAVAAFALAGCGEISNTITAIPGTADTLTVALPTAPSANYVGIYEAQALGYFRQADLDVRFVTGSGGGVTDQLPALEAGAVQVAVSSEPAVLAARNENEALVSVGAIIEGPLKRNIEVRTGAGSKSGRSSGGSRSGSRTRSSSRTRTGSRSGTGSGSRSGSGSGTSKPVTYENVADLSLLPPSIRTRKNLPPYDGLVLVVRKGTIVNRAPLIRRFVQAVARGYRAALAEPTRAIQHLIAVNPSLSKQHAQVVGGVQWVLASTFPGGGRPWGWQRGSQWNAFGTWMTDQHLMSNPNATPDASTNELLAGQGV